VKQSLIYFLAITLPTFLLANSTDSNTTEQTLENNSSLVLNWSDEIPMYVYGDATFFETIYEFISSVVSDPTIQIIVGLGIGITLFLGGLRLKDGDMSGFGKSALAPITLIALFLTPAVDVHIVDVRVDEGLVTYNDLEGKYAKVEGVPYAIAFVPASAMLITKLTIELIDNNWQDPEDFEAPNKFVLAGFMGLANTFLDIFQHDIFDSSLDANSSVSIFKAQYYLETYISECILNKAAIYPKNKGMIKSSPLEYPQNLNPAKFPKNFGDEKIDYKSYESEYMIGINCSDAYSNMIVAYEPTISAFSQSVLKKKYPNLDLENAAATEIFNALSGASLNAIGGITKAVNNVAVYKELQRQKGLTGIGIDGYSSGTNITIDKTLANLSMEGPAKFAWMSRVLPDLIFLT
jgi:hypothetical protein